MIVGELRVVIWRNRFPPSFWFATNIDHSGLTFVNPSTRRLVATSESQAPFPSEGLFPRIKLLKTNGSTPCEPTISDKGVCGPS